MIALSCDEVEAHNGWIGDIKAYNGLTDFNYPIIADPSREIAMKYSMLDPVAKDNAGMPLTCRWVTITNNSSDISSMSYTMSHLWCMRESY